MTSNPKREKLFKGLAFLALQSDFVLSTVCVTRLPGEFVQRQCIRDAPQLSPVHWMAEAETE